LLKKLYFIPCLLFLASCGDAFSGFQSAPSHTTGELDAETPPLPNSLSELSEFSWSPSPSPVITSAIDRRLPANNQVVDISISLASGESLKNKTLTLTPESREKLIGTVTLADGSRNSNLRWHSEDERIATVNLDGEVIALKIGTVTIAATYLPVPSSIARQIVSVVAEAQLGSLNFAGRVYDQQSQLLNGVVLEARSLDGAYRQITTTQDGMFVFRDAPVNTPITLKASKSGYSTQTQEIQLSHEGQVSTQYDFKEQLALIAENPDIPQESPSPAEPEANVTPEPEPTSALPEATPSPTATPVPTATPIPTPTPVPTPTPIPVPTTGSVTGQVRNNETGNGEPGATVKIGSLTATTDAQGYYTLHNVSAGQRTLSVSKTGFTSPSSVSVGVIAGDTVTATILTLTRQYWSLQMSGTSATLHGLHFLDANTGWVAGNGGVLLKTTNGGSNWQFMSVPTYDYRAVYFVTAQQGYLSTSNGRILKTTDGGQSWSEQVLDNLGSCNSNQLQFINSQTGYVACYGLWRTTDGGANWTRVFHAFTSFIQFHFWSTSQGAMARSHVSPYLTTNGGTQWQQVSGVPQMSFIQYLDAQTLVSYSSSSFHKSTNGGLSWQSTQPFIINQSTYSVQGLHFASSSHGWAIRSNTPPTIFHTQNGGQNWSKQETIYTGSFSVNAMQFINQNTGWAIGNSGVILKY